MKNAFSSLRFRFVIVFLFALLLGVSLYFIVTMLADTYISTVYTAPENKKEREEGYLSDLQDYIDSYAISSEQTGKISEWARENPYVYLLIYKDDKIFFTSDDAEKPEKDDTGADDGEDTPPNDGDDTTPEPGGGKGDGADEEAPGTDDDGPLGDGSASDESGKQEENGEGKKEDTEEEDNPGVTIKYPSREELLEYARKNDMHIIELTDGPLFASFAEFTEYLYYDISNILSIVIAVFAIVLVMLIYIQRVTLRIIRLGEDVNAVAEGETERKIRARGHDEISQLASDVDEMRNSLIETVKSEREAMNSNSALITSMSHDIRTPLTVLLGYMDVMSEHSKDDAEMQGYIKAAETTALRLKKLSDDMFSYFLVFGGKEIAAQLERYDAEALIEQMLSEHFLLMSENGYTIEHVGFDTVNFDGREIYTDAVKLNRIFDNAFSNVYKYADKKKSVKIIISADACEINLTIKNYVRSDTEKVESNGIGLKTCDKLSEIIGAKFSHGFDENEFYVNISLPFVKE